MISNRGRLSLALLLLFYSALAVLTQSAVLANSALAQDVLTVNLDGTINPASDDVISSALQYAKSEDFQALVILLDTPGGGLEETESILGLMSASSIPVIGYVYPEGATAWSAGTLILMGTDIAAMAPHAIIGSAQPVKLSPTGGTEPINDSKTTNAVVALIEERARAHGRNTTAAGEFVRSNLNLNADDAKRYGLVEYVSPDINDLLSQVDGQVIKNRTLSTAGSRIEEYHPPLNLIFLEYISYPMLAGILMIVGLYALIFGLSSPGIGAEVFGLVALSIGLIGLGFDVNIGAIFLILLGVGLLLAELYSHSFGIMATAGLACVIAGSILLVPSSYPEWYVPGDYQRTMLAMFVLPSLILGGFFALAVYKVTVARLAPPVMGKFVGEVAEAIDKLDPQGYVLYQGEYWSAQAESPVEKGEKVVIVAKDGSVLKVRRR